MKKLLLAILTATLTLSIFCFAGCKHECVYDQEVASENYLVSAATCTAPAVYKKSCKCGKINESVEETFEYGEPIGHSFTNYVSNNDATCENDGTKTAYCNNGCGEKDIVIDENSAIGHSFTNYVSDNNSTAETIGTKTAVCDHGCGATDSIPDDAITFKTCTFKGLTSTKIVRNSDTEFDFNEEITVNGNSEYLVCLDANGFQTSKTNKAELTEGDNVFYILEYINDEYSKTYVVTIHRNLMLTVRFNSCGGSSIESQTIEEGFCATVPTEEPTRNGYTFDGWDYDFSTPITQDTTIKAKWQANTNTAYKVEYYLQNLEDNDYTLTTTENKTGTTDTTATAEIKKFEHFTYSPSETDSGNIALDGSTVLKVYYTRNTYTVIFDGNGETKTNGSTTQTVKYGGSVTEPTFTKKGYTFNKWDKSLTNISENQTITAMWKINQYTLTINFGNGQESKIITQDYNSEINYELPTDIQRNGYTFNGYDKTMPTTMPAYDMTITAKLLAIFYLNGSTITGLTAHGKTLTEIAIPSTIDGVEITSIKYGSFKDCSSLTSITISDGVTSIGDSIFYKCASLESVYYTGTIDQWVQINFSNDYSNPLYYAKNLYINNALVTEANIITATKINAYAFYGYSKLTSVTIGNSITSIGGAAFYKCSNLTSITIPDSVTSIGNYAFYYCSKLTSITIPDSVTSISDYAFYCCSSLKYNEYDNAYYLGNDSNPYLWLIKTKSTYLESFTINENCKFIYKDAFNGCSSLISITVDESNTNYSSFDGILYNKSQTEFIYIPNAITSVTISNSITSIKSSAFSRYSKLTSVTIPDGVTSISSYAFYYCSSLTSVTIGNGVTYIGAYAFYDCSSLTSVTIGNGVTYIGAYAFYDCSSLTSVTIGNGVTSIGSSAFEYCSSLESVYYTGTIDQWSQINFSYISNPLYYAKNLYINNALVTEANITTATKINDYAFYNCDNLTSVTIGNSVTSIGNYAFNGCSSLTSVIIPDSVTSIGGAAFYKCSNLTSITIPDSVTSIGDYVFCDCSSLTSVTIGNSITSIGKYAFSSCWNLKSVTFENPNGWYVSKSSTATSGTGLTLTNTSTNASYFKSIYYDYYWYKV